MKSWKNGLRAIKELIAGWLFPRAARCLCCGDPRRASEEDCLCGACREKLKEWRVPASACERCLSPVTPGRPCAFCASPMMRPIEAVFAPYRFGGETRALIHALKFDACGEAVPLLARAITDALPKRDFDCIVPVPLHPARLRQRGFNQTLLLGEALSARTGIPVRELLRRDRYHAPQSRLSAKRRTENVRGAFSCIGDASGKRILLLDDVRTTGSTACACAQALKNAGEASVCLCVTAVVYRKK